MTNHKVTSKNWNGACLDTGAQTTVIGLNQAKAYCRYMRVKLKTKENSNKYKFGEDQQNSLGSMRIRIPIPDHKMITERVDIVKADVPFLIGLDLLDKYKFYVNNVDNCLCSTKLNLKIPLVRKHGHLYLEWSKNDTIMYTKSELFKLHRNFSHPTSERLLNLLKLARPYENHTETRKIIEDICRNCDTCQRFSVPPVRFKVSLPNEDELVFGDEISIDLMFLDNCSVLHVVDTATRFSAATFLDKHGETYGQSVEGIWQALASCWFLIYTGYPNRIRSDQGSTFTSVKWKSLVESKGISMRLSGIRAHSSLGIGEKLHDPLRRIFKKIRHEYPSANPKTILRVAVKAMNDTMGENGLVPSRLVFGILPRFPILNSNLPSQKERMEIIKTAHAEMNSIIAERRITAALTRNVPSAADRHYKPNDEVLVYDEQSQQWKGPYIVLECKDRMVNVTDQNRISKKLFNAFQLKPYFRQLNYNFYSFEPNCFPTFDTCITEIIKQYDPRASMFKKPIKKEIDGLIAQNTWKVVCRDEVPDKANILRGRFVLAIKDEGTEREVWKARFVVQGHRDNLKKSLVHDITVARQHSIKLLIGLASIFNFRLFSTDVTQAYLQSKESLQRNIFVKPPKEFGLQTNELLKLLKPLYGLSESGDYWGRTFRNHMTKELGMKNCITDTALFYKSSEAGLAGLCTTYVDDALYAGNKTFEETTKKTEQKFKCKKREYDNLQFSGLKIETKENMFLVHQKSYISKLKALPKNAQFTHFRSLRAMLSWTTNSRPDISCAMALMAQVTEEKFQSEPAKYIKKTNNVLKQLHENPEVYLQFPKLKLESLKLSVYSDASYASNDDKSSQLGYFIFLSDDSKNCQPLYWNSYKSKRVTRSVLGSEVMAFADAFDMAYTIKYDLQHIIQNRVRLHMLTDSLSLFDVLTRNHVTTEKRLMIDLKNVTNAYHSKEIDDIAFVRSEFNIADALTKTKSQEFLIKTLTKNKLEHPIDQWIV